MLFDFFKVQFAHVIHYRSPNEIILDWAGATDAIMTVFKRREHSRQPYKKCWVWNWVSQANSCTRTEAGRSKEISLHSLHREGGLANATLLTTKSLKYDRTHLYCFQQLCVKQSVIAAAGGSYCLHVFHAVINYYI